MSWKDGRLVSAEFRAAKGGRALLRYGTKTRELALEAGETFTWNGR
jgi:hypothetical protein